MLLQKYEAEYGREQESMISYRRKLQSTAAENKKAASLPQKKPEEYGENEEK